MSSVVETITSNPALAVALVVVVRAAVAYQRELSWSEYRTLHAGKRTLFPILDRLTPGGFEKFVLTKQYQDSPEYVDTILANRRDVVAALRAGGGELHLISSLKRRETPDGPQTSTAHLVWSHGDGTQTEAYLFPAVGQYGTDLYVHHETSVAAGIDHVTDPDASAGDPRGVVRDALDTDGAIATAE